MVHKIKSVSLVMMMIKNESRIQQNLLVATVVVATVVVGLAGDGTSQCKHAATPIVSVALTRGGLG